MRDGVGFDVAMQEALGPDAVGQTSGVSGEATPSVRREAGSERPSVRELIADRHSEVRA